VLFRSLAFLIIAGFFMSLMRGHLISRGWAAALANAPLLLALLLWQRITGWQIILVIAALALPGLAALRDTFHEASECDFIDASRALGRTRAGVWWRHVLPGTMPGMLNWTLRNVASAMTVFCVLDFFSQNQAASSSWGHLMRQAAGGILDDALLALAPALLLALWSLSFRLLSRAFRTEAPQPRNSSFAS
jgi:oligopeptide transport system permease protein